MRDLVVKNVLAMFPTAGFMLNLDILLNRIRPGVIHNLPQGASAVQAVNIIVDLAITQGWVSNLVAEIPRNPSNQADLDLIQQLLAAQPAPTADDPHDEVLLEGGRPFVNRVDLRSNLKALYANAGATLLLVRGEPQTGKSFSFYLTQHIARITGFITSQFEVGKTPRPDELASAVLERIGAHVALRPQGPESAQRWAEKLAGQVKDALEAQKLKRVFVFDDFPVNPQPPLPPETESFIVRLAKYSDEELRPYLRVVLIQFTAPLPPALDDVAEVDEAVPFTSGDMLAVMKQVSQARKWAVTEQALKTEIDALQGSATLRDRFKLLRNMIKKLGASVPPPPPPGGTG